MFKVGDKVRIKLSNGLDLKLDGIEGEIVETKTTVSSVKAGVASENVYKDSSNFYLWFRNYNLEKLEMKVPYTVTTNSIVVLVDGQMYTVNKSDLNFKDLSDYLKTKDNHDEEELKEILDKEKYFSAITQGDVTLKAGEVFYKGEEVNLSVTAKLLQMLEEGFDVKPWLKFLDNLMQNPSFNSRENLYDLLDNHNTPITEDGCFIGFKRVRNNYKDIYSGKFDNSPGTVVEMPRHMVDDSPNNTCSRGLHVCASEYLGSFYASSPNCIVVSVKVNPKDVVAVPHDYRYSKMRVSKYEVIGPVSLSDVKKIDSTSYYDPVYWDEYRDDSPWY